MGVQILNKDVSVVSQIMGKVKSDIGSIFTAAGWNEQPPPPANDVTPNPTPNWTDNETENPVYSSTVQIQGINTQIELAMTILNSDGGTLSVGVNTVNEYGGNETTFIIDPTTFSVNPNEYVTFKWEGDAPGYTVNFDVNNQSDGGTLLDNITLVRTSGV